MAEKNWYSNGNVDWNAASAWNTQADGLGTALTNPDDEAHVIIQGNDTITLTAALHSTIRSLTIDSGSDLDGHASYIIETTDEGNAIYGTNGYAVKINGTTDSNVNITVGGTFSTLVDLDGTMGNLILKGSGSKQFRGTPTIGGNVTIQDSCPVDCAGAVQINGNFTITSGSYSTGSDHALTVTGITTVYGTLTLNDSVVSLGAAYTTDYGLEAAGGGSDIDMGGATVTTGAVNIPSGDFIMTSETWTISSTKTSTSAFLNIATTDTFSHGSGILKFTSSGGGNVRSNQGLNNIIIDAVSGTPTWTVVTQGFSCAGYFTLTDGTFDTGGFNLTVTGDVTNGGTLLINASAVSSRKLISTGTLTGADGGVYTVTGAGLGNTVRTIDLGGTVSGDTDITLTGAGNNRTEDLQASGNIRNLIINNAAAVVKTGRATTLDGNLTITAGTLNTDGDHALTVAGGVSGAGTLTTNASAISFGYLTMTGTYNATTDSSGTILTDRSGPGAQLIMDAADIVHNNGYFVFKGAAGGASYIGLNGASDATNGIYNVEIHASGRTVNISAYNLSIHNNLYVTIGTLDTTTLDLTVTGAIDITGTLTGNASAISAGGLRVNNTGIFNAPTSVGSCSITGELSSYAFRISGGGTLNNNTGTITFLNVNSRLMMNGTGNIYNLTLNHASCFIMLHSDGTTTIEGNLTITAGQLTTYMEGTTTSKDLTVAGTTSISGTLTCNDSDITLGTGKTDGWALSIGTTGTFTGGGGTHIIGSISTTAWGSPSITLSSTTTTINSKFISNGYSINCAAGTTFAHGGGSVIMTYAGSTLIQFSGGTLAFNDFEYNASGHTLTLESPISCAGDLYANAGTIDTKSAENNAITVTGQLKVNGANGILTGQLSAIEVRNVLINSGGTFTHNGVLTITGKSTDNDYAFEGAGTWTPSSSQRTTFTGAAGTYHVKSNDWNAITIVANAAAFYYFRPKSGTGITWNTYITLTTGNMLQNALGDSWAVGGTLRIDSGIVGLSTPATGSLTFGAITINGGTFNAPNGTTTVSGDMVSNGTLTHNDGKFVFNEHLEVSGTSLTFYNVSAELGVTKTVDFMNDFTVENELDGNNQWRLKASSNTVTLTLGTTSSQGTLDTAAMTSYGFEWDSNTSNFVKIKGASSLKPAIIEGTNIDWDDVSGGLVSLEDCDFQGAIITGGGGVTLTLTGDCEFDNVTVSAGDTLDLNGQRAEFSGQFNAQGTDGLKDSAGGGMMFSADLNYQSLSAAHSSVNTIHYIANAVGTHYIQEYPFKTIFTNSGGITDFADYGPLQAAATDNFIVGDTATGFGLGGGAGVGSSTFGNINIATGGTLTGGGDTLTVAGDFNMVGGLIGKSALNLTGSEEVTGSDNLDEVATTNKFTIEAWFKASTDANYRGIFSRGTGNDAGNLYVYQDAGGNVKVSATDLGNTLTSTTAGLADGKWHHVAYTYDTTTIKLYIDGKLEATAASTAGINTQTNGFKIGDRSGQNFIGNIGRVSIWKSALSETLIRKMFFMDWTTMAADSDFTDSDAIGWWQFDEGTSTAVEDLSSQSNDGTLNSAAWAGAGTLNWTSMPSNPTGGTLKMNGPGTLTVPSAAKIFNLTVGTSGQVTLAGTPYIYGLLTVDVNGITDGSTNATIGIVNLTPVLHAGVNLSAINQIHYQTGGSAITIYPTTYDNCRITASSQATLVGALGATTLQVDGSCSLIAQNTTITTRGLRINGSDATLDIAGTTVTLTDATPYGFTGANSTTTLSAGPGTSIIGHADRSTFYSQNNLSVVGKIENLDVTNEELNVTGQVINCTGFIHQQHPTVDANQQLDFDTADDRDIHLGRDIDKNTELVG